MACWLLAGEPLTPDFRVDKGGRILVRRTCDGLQHRLRRWATCGVVRTARLSRWARKLQHASRLGRAADAIALPGLLVSRTCRQCPSAGAARQEALEPRRRRIRRRYTVLISLNYFVQLTLVAPRLARGHVQGIEAFLFVPFDSFLYAVDILGYSFMSAVTLFASRVFLGGGLHRTA